MLPFALTIFTGAFLLFLVQPLIGKYILPWFGGTPGVWTTCMLFFQMVLLAGYAYAHFLSRWLQPRGQAAVHLGVLLASLAVLPIIPGDAWKPKPGDAPITHILLLLGATIGLPYFVVSTTGPLMQSWFARLNPGKSPYRLYALSNIGSLLALLAYPFLIEPNFARKLQALSWGWGLVAYVLFAAWCVRLVWVRGFAAQTPADGHLAEEEPAEEPSLRRKFLWLALPACASALLLATTNKLTQDVAVIPFLWVLPLSLYLLTFILCFDANQWYWRPLFLPAMLACFGWLIYVLANINDVGIGWQVPAFCLTLFVGCMVCHGELYALKPHPRWLTSFYLMISLGGAIGGFLVAVVAPHVFKSYAELAWSCGACAVLVWLVCLPNWRVPGFQWWRFHAWLAGSLVALAVCLAFYIQSRERDNVVEATRNFYGAMSVLEYGKETPGSRYLLLQHGRITHGFQLTDPDQRRRITSYYGEQSGVALAIRNFPRPQKRIGVVGLGTGTTAAFGEKGDYVRIYEINEEVRRIATSHFTFIKDTQAVGGKVDVIMGDARLSMELHISNRYLDLEPVLANLGADLRLVALGCDDMSLTDAEFATGREQSHWVVMARGAEDLAGFQRRARWSPLEGRAGVGVWTDDFSSPLRMWQR